MLFFHNYQALKYGRVDGLAAYTFIGAVESLGSLLMTGLAPGCAAAGRLSLRRRPSPPAEHYRQHGLLYRFRIGNCADVRIGCRTRRFSAWFNLHGNAAVLAAHGLVISSTAFVLLGVIRVAGYYYQATGKITDSSLLIYGDALSRCPVSVCAAVVVRSDGVWLAMPVSRVLLFLFVCYLWFGRKKRRPYKMQHFSARR